MEEMAYWECKRPFIQAPSCKVEIGTDWNGMDRMWEKEMELEMEMEMERERDDGKRRDRVRGEGMK